MAFTPEQEARVREIVAEQGAAYAAAAAPIVDELRALRKQIAAICDGIADSAAAATFSDQA